MKDKVLVLDTNVMVKMFVDEELSELAIKLIKLSKLNNIRFISPSFAKIEFYSIIRKKESLDLIVNNDYAEILRLFSKLEISFENESFQWLDNSFKLAKKLNQVSIYDCIFVELAKREKADFISEDTKFLKQAKKIYKNCFNIREYLKKTGE